MIKIVKTALTTLGILACIALGGLGGWYAKASYGEAVSGSVDAKIFAAPMELPAGDEGLIIFLSGGGFRKRGNSWKEIEPGNIVGSGDSLRTVEGGAADVQFGEFAVVRLRQNSAAVFDDITAGKNGSLSVKITAGTVLFKVARGAGKVMVETPDGNLSVVGTEFLVRTGGNGTFTAVREGVVSVEGAAEVREGQWLSIGAEGSGKQPEALSEAGTADLEELSLLKILEMPDTGVPLMARVILETSPADAAIFLDGMPFGRGTAALVAPFGQTLNVTVSKAGYSPRRLEIPILSAEAEKRYLIRLEADPGAEIRTAETEGIERILKLENQISALENEIKSRELLYRVVSNQSSTLGTERDLLLRDAETARKETDAAHAETAAVRKQITALEGQVTELKTALEQEKERVRQIMELLKE
jgi:hypothetical protein